MDDDQKQALEELRIIRQMMERTTRRWTGEGFAIWAVWGIGGIVAALASEVLVTTGRHFPIPILWNVYWIVGLVLTISFARRYRNAFGQRVTTFGGRVLAYVWIAVGVSLLATFCASTYMRSFATLPTTWITMVGTGVYITGAVLQERIFSLAGVVWWFGAVAALFFPEHVYLIEAALMLFGFLLPAWIIRSRGSQGSSSAREPLRTPA